ncbi:hypothetical protein [Paenibacillus jiagnxiensis]|uniref:hypothetical protein n=1 Tax=Paenibacillus jiagnxiensis TaxID=3228926 RepID=UPI0033AEB391
MWSGTEFHNPGPEWRIHPFWFWNGRMEDSEIIRQIQEMADKGIGGFMICARQGLDIPYLSEDWFAKVKTAVEAAKSAGLQVWLYDEFPYPSGMAGGEVTLELPEAVQRLLVHRTARVHGGERIRMELPWARVLYASAVPIRTDGSRDWTAAADLRERIGSVQPHQLYQETGLTSYNRKRFFTYDTAFRLDWQAPPGLWEIIVFLEEELHNFKYYGNLSDPCHEEAVATFITLTHERYAATLGEEFGATVKGMFTDEIAPLGSLPWSARLPERYRKECGRELPPLLPALLYGDFPDAAAIRYQYFQTLHLMLRESYHRTIGRWCHDAGLQYAAEVPSFRMAGQLFSHVPGGDSAHEKTGVPLRQILEKDAVSFRTNPKMVSSLARQMSRERSLIECFHSVGWSMTLQDAKWMLDRLAALGTNFFNFHAFFYTIGGLRKHDAPPSQFLQNPYWPYFRQLGDYAGRLAYLMGMGEAHIRIAILDPVTSLWSLMGNPLHRFGYGGRDQEEASRLERLKNDWTALSTCLLLEGMDYDHLDPEMLQKARITDGRIELGTAQYDVLLMPPQLNIEGAAWKQVKRFAEQGGTVIAAGLLPHVPIQEHSPAAEECMELFGLHERPEAYYWEEKPYAGDTPWLKGRDSVYFVPYSSADMPGTVTALLEQIYPAAVRWIPDQPCRSFLVHTRLIDQMVAVFISNQEGQAAEGELRLWPERLFTSGAAESDGGTEPSGKTLRCARLDLETGEVHSLPDTGSLPAVLRLHFDGYESQAFLFAPGSAADFSVLDFSSSSGTNKMNEAESIALQMSAEGPWTIEALQPNNLRLGDFLLKVLRDDGTTVVDAYKVACKTFIEQVAPLAQDGGLPFVFRQEFGVPKKAGLAYPFHCVYETSFDLQYELPDALLFMDRTAIAGEWSITMNGQELLPGHFHRNEITDHDNIACEIGHLLRLGRNVLNLKVAVTRDWDGLLDPLYIRGNFGVHWGTDGVPVLMAPSSEVPVLQAGPYPGYPHYAGTFRFRRKLRKSEEAVLQGAGNQTRGHSGVSRTESGFSMEFDHWNIEDTAEIRVNGSSLGVRPWSPYRWHGSSEILSRQGNEVEVYITNTLIGVLEGNRFDKTLHRVCPVDELQTARKEGKEQDHEETN